MANGNNEVLKKIRDVIEKGGQIDPNTRDVLLFSAIVDIYDWVEKLQPVLTFYKVSMFFFSSIGLGILGFIGALLMGKIELVFK
jgi:hypothetical protein